MVNKLDKLVADFTVFYQKLRHYHWNIKGKQFFVLHAKFEEIYDEFNMAIDELAEQIVALGGTPVHTLAGVLEHATIKEDESTPSGSDMVKLIKADMETLNADLLAAIEAAEEAGDRTTTNLLDELRDGIQGSLWMIEAYLA